MDRSERSGRSGATPTRCVGAEPARIEQRAVFPALLHQSPRRRLTVSPDDWPATIGALAASVAVTAVNVVDVGLAVFDGTAGAIRIAYLLTILVSAVIAGRYASELRNTARVAQERAREAEERRNLAAQSPASPSAPSWPGSCTICSPTTSRRSRCGRVRRSTA